MLETSNCGRSQVESTLDDAIFRQALTARKFRNNPSSTRPKRNRLFARLVQLDVAGLGCSGDHLFLAS